MNSNKLILLEKLPLVRSSSPSSHIDKAHSIEQTKISKLSVGISQSERPNAPNKHSRQKPFS